jgi:hypothetical protein
MHRLGFLLLVVSAAGCGQQEFNARVEKGLTGVRHLGKFGDLDLKPSTIPDTPVSLRLPKDFITRLPANSANPEGEGAMPPERMQPPGFNVPNMRLLCQAILSDERGAPVPVFCHIAAQQKDANGPPLSTTLHEQIKAAYPDATDWEEVSCETPTIGETVTCKRLEAKGEQNFQKFGVISPNPMTGVIETCFYESEGWDVVIVIRVPELIASRVPYVRWARAMCGTLKVSP